MEQIPYNPSSNILGTGVSASDVATAIERSGYPLQTVVASFLRDEFGIQDEWSYLDRDTKELRTIDLLGEKWLYDLSEKQPRVRPTVNLLIECKQSDLPYVFFLSPSKPRLREFPIIAGLAQDKIEIITDDSGSTWIESILPALGLNSHQFLESPEYCHTLSKCVRKGKGLALSGSESYSNLILPIIKSLLHFQAAEEPPKTAYYFDSHVAIGVGVLDAPMVGVNVSNKSNELILVPWVRVVRHEYFEDLERWDRSKLLAVDVVHKDFFQQYIQNHVKPFARDYAELAIKHQEVLATGKAFVSRMGNDSWRDLEARLKPRNVRATTTRTKVIFQNIFRVLTGRKPSI